MSARLSNTVLQGQHAAATDPIQKPVAAMLISYGAAGPIDMGITSTSLTIKLRTVREYVGELRVA